MTNHAENHRASNWTTVDNGEDKESERRCPPVMSEEYRECSRRNGEMRETHALTLLGAFLVQNSIPTLTTNDNISRTQNNL